MRCVLHVSPLTNGRFHKAPVRVNSTKHIDASRSQKLPIIMTRRQICCLDVWSGLHMELFIQNQISYFREERRILSRTLSLTCCIYVYALRQVQKSKMEKWVTNLAIFRKTSAKRYRILLFSFTYPHTLDSTRKHDLFKNTYFRVHVVLICVLTTH